MPMVTIQITRENVSAEAKKALIAGVSELLLTVLDKPLDSTFVVIEEVPLENWGVGGLPVEAYRRRQKKS